MKQLTLLVLESLKRTTPFFSKNNLACWVKNKLAPSTTYLKFGLPSGSIRLLTFEMLTASGRPPQGTKRSALTRKWKLFRKSVPSGMISPADGQLVSINGLEEAYKAVGYPSDQRESGIPRDQASPWQRS